MLYRQIILEWGQDTESGVWGLGYSPDNGKNFYVLNTTHGRKYRAEDGNRLYPYISDQIQDKIDTVVAPAESAANSAYSMASQAVEQANVTKQAQAATDQAITEAKQGANDAMSRAKSAWDVATGAKEAVTDFDPLLKQAHSDASKAITQIADTASALSDAKTAFNSDVAVAKNLANTARVTADSAATVAVDARSNATVAIQTASQASITAKNASGQAASAVLTANGALTTASNAKSDATVAIQTASGASLTATNAKSDATFAKQTASEAKIQASNAESDFAQLSVRANKIEANVANNSGAIASVQQTANGLTTTVGNVDNRVKKIEDTTNWTTKTGALDMDTLTTTQNIYYRDSNLKNADGEAGWAYIQVVSVGERVTQTVWHDRSSIQHTRTGAVSGSSYNWDAWNKVATNAQVVQVKQTVDGISATINDPKTGLNATYQTAAGNATTISNVKSDVYQLETTASGLTSRVGNLESKTSTQETAINQNKNAITLKADQTDVDTVKGTVAGLQSSLTVQGNQIQSKVSASDVSGMLKGYATQDYTQSLVTQKADDWNLNLTKLQTDVNAIKTTGGGVNLLQGTRDFSGINIQGGKVAVTNGGESFQAAFGKQNPSYFYFDLVNFKSIPLEKDTDYTASFWVKTSKDTDIWSFLYDSGSNGVYADEATVNHSTTDYTRIVVHFHNGNNTATPNFIPVRIKKNSTITVWVYGCMLEKGTVAHDWSPAPSDMATVTSVTNLSATVDGIKSTVANKADQSTVTQLSNVVQSKVSSGDFTSTTTQLKNLINQRVQVGDVISQINQEAGGNTLIQVSNGKGSLILDAANTIVTGKAWIPDAAISSISADKIMLGSSALYNSDGTLNLVNKNDGTTSKITVSQGNVNFDGVNKNASIIKFASDNNTNAFTVNPTGATVTPTLFFERFDQTVGHWLGFTRNEVEHEGVTFHTWDDEAERFFISCHARCDKNLRVLGTLSQGSWDGTPAKPEAGILTIKNGNTIWSGSDFLAVGSNVTGTYTGIWAKSFSQQSTLSSKTNIETVNPKDALDLINKTDIRSYQYKSDVAEGHTKRYTSLIIDDVNDVSQYYTPDEFINEERTGRDDGSAVGYLFLAVKELTRRIKTLEEKLNG
ncbi:hypothetical protein CYJ85_00465 [Limosilactobacillus fermentum]|uniref:tail fiber domain-containing protein n=1 Tax=Limosilactobacillus fermentum TaxID=1613 RepID=UPI000C7A7B08|nr:tail fiber domain-containing protein [Limosilactobacillus fermentum]PLT15952.1 hypothetical protein CYJ85_00465 [Limosilactobacillus fermentum]